LELARPVRASTALTQVGRILLPFAGASLLASWILGGVLGFFCATSCALLALALLITRWHVGSLRLGSPAAIQVQVGDTFTLAIDVKNTARILHARDVVFACGVGDEKDLRPEGHMLVLRPGETRRVHVVHRLHQRGRHKELHIVLSSAFPFGLVRRRLYFQLPVNILGLPRLGSLHDLGRLPLAKPRLSATPRPRERGEEEFYGVRDWREGESVRRVHWRLSARRGRRIVREFRQNVEPAIQLVFVTCVSRPLTVGVPKRMFERSVSLAATVAEHFLRRGRAVRLTIAGEHADLLPEVRGRAGLLHLLAVLAEVHQESGDPRGALERARTRLGPQRAELIGVLVGDSASERAPAGALLLDVQDPDIDTLFLPGRPWSMSAPLHRGRAV